MISMGTTEHCNNIEMHARIFLVYITHLTFAFIGPATEGVKSVMLTETCTHNAAA